MEDTSVTDRVTTGIAGLDAILMGGLLNGSTVITQGPPGSGKTILANQLAFHRACQGELVVYVTLVAESHTRLLRHLRTLTFFEPSLVGDRILYLSGYHALRESATALLALLQKELVVRRPGLLVVDGISAIQETHGVPAARQFLHELQASTESANCTALLVSATQTSPTPEDAVVDAAIFLAEHQVGVRPIREIQVHKTRGSSHLAGRHTFIIDARGLVVFPRIEALYRMPSQAPSEGETRVGFGRTGLDAMVGGGLRSGSSTLLLGATGTGKTLLGLTFLAAGLSHNETVIYSGFYETPDRLLASGDGIGLRLRDQAAAGRLHLEWRPPVELFIDAWADRLLERVRTTRPRRLFIDGLNAILEGATRPERLFGISDRAGQRAAGARGDDADLPRDAPDCRQERRRAAAGSLANRREHHPAALRRGRYAFVAANRGSENPRQRARQSHSHLLNHRGWDRRRPGPDTQACRTAIAAGAGAAGHEDASAGARPEARRDRRRRDGGGQHARCLLRHVGMEGIVTSTATEALGVIAETTPDAIVTDFMMPGMNGHDLVRAVRGNRRFVDVPLILMSAVPEAAAKDSPADAFLAKLLDLDETERVLRQLTAGERKARSRDRR